MIIVLVQDWQQCDVTMSVCMALPYRLGGGAGSPEKCPSLQT